MANLKVFISSTCYDLHATRAQLRGMLVNIGYEPVMSDQSDVIYDPRIHTHTSCLREVINCDVLVLLVGSRFGGTTVPKALDLVDLDHLTDLSRAERFGEDKTKISITQAEVLQAIQTGLPVFAFVDAGVMRDHLTYEKNKNKPIINQIEFSSIDKADTAAYIFEFINFLRLRNENNSVYEFTRFEDIEFHLKKQWAGLFQRLLHEQRTKSIEGRRIENLSSQIADLKAAVLSSISNRELKETAKGTIRFRHVLDFLLSIGIEYRPIETMRLLRSTTPWDDLLKALGIIEIKPDESRARFVPSMILIRDDNTYYRARHSIRMIPRFTQDWNEFQSLGPDTKDAILNAVLDSRESRSVVSLRHYDEPYIEGNIQRPNEEIDQDSDTAPASRPSRILLTKNSYIEDMLKIFLNSTPESENKRFLINVTDDSVNISVLPEAMDGISKAINLKYETPKDDDLSPVIESLKAQIVAALKDIHASGQQDQEASGAPATEP